MAFEHPGVGALDYLPCRYGESRLLFRGPKQPLDGAYAAFFGSTETYGRFVDAPFPALVGERLRVSAVNLGCVNAGVDVFARDRALLDIAAGARVTVIQVMGAQNLSNRFYSVHPRRNDRFIGPTDLMKATFGEIDFTDFAFTRHLLAALQTKCADRFDMVVEALKSAWIARMRELLAAIGGQKVLLWLADHRPEDTPAADCRYRNDPLFVDRSMLDALDGAADDYVEVVYDRGDRAHWTDGMVFSELEAPVAMQTPGVVAHETAAAALSERLAGLFDG